MFALLLSLVFATVQPVDVLGKALTQCPLNHRPTEAQAERIKVLYQIETEEGVPEFARGLLLAAACRESAYRLRPGCGDKGASCGVFQFHGSHRRRLRAMGAVGPDPRLDWRVAGRYWLRHLKRQLPRVRRDCRGRGGYPSRAEYLWASANKTATWKAKCGRRGRCRKQNAEGGCVKWYCVRIAARCSVPPWRWRKTGTHRRQETKHFMTLRRWRSSQANRLASGNNSHSRR